MQNRHRWRSASAGAALAFVSAASPLFAAGCGGGDSLILVAGQRIDSTKLDSDPVSILPSGILMFSYIDAATMFHSSLGPDVATMVQTLLPLGPESNFVPTRDVTRIFAGAYAMQGADFCAVVQGSFDVEAIRRSVDARAVSLAGVPLAKNRYADNDLYTAGNIGFTVLTAHTVLSGNETGMRRALDRIRYGKLTRAVPEWMTNLGRTPGAAFALAGDLSAQSPTGAAFQSMPFLAGANALRVIGNFQAPGMNFAGTLSFNDETSAETSASAIQSINSISPFMSLLANIGLGITIPPIQVARQVKDVGFTIAVDESTARVLLRKGGDLMRSAIRVNAPR
jgi:hypothetical protein